MPRKVKKLTPEELEAAFEEFKQTEEYELWGKANRIREEVTPMDTGTKDMIDEKFHDFIDVFGQLIKKFKGKPKKELKYEYFRGFIIGSRNVGIDET